jgi:PAS domain-containing protein
LAQDAAVECLDDAALTALLDAAPVAAALISLDGQRVRPNRAFVTMFDVGFTAEMAANPSCDALVRAALAGNAGEFVACWFDRGDASRIALEISATPLRTTDGALGGTVVWYKDVTALQSLIAEREVLRSLFEVCGALTAVGTASDSRGGRLTA